MLRPVEVIDKETARDAIIAVGQELIRRAEDIVNDLERVNSIEIYAILNPTEVTTFDITKKYTACIEKADKK